MADPFLPAVQNLPQMVLPQGDAAAGIAAINAGNPPPQKSWAPIAAIATGAREFAGLSARGVQGIGSALGMKGLSGWAAAQAAAQDAAAQQSDIPEYSGDYSSPAGIGYNVLKSLPGLGMTMKGFGVGGQLAERAGYGELGQKVGAALGGGLVQLPGAIGGNVQAAQQANNGQLSQQDAAKAVGLGLPEAAIGSWMPGRLESVMKKGLEGSLGARVLKGAASNALVGGVQSGVDTALTDTMDPNMSAAQRAQNIVTSALQGGISGGVIGGAIHGISGKKLDPNASTEDLTAAATVPATTPAEEAAAPAAPTDETEQAQQFQQARWDAAAQEAGVTRTPQTEVPVEAPDFRSRFQEQADQLPPEVDVPQAPLPVTAEPTGSFMGDGRDGRGARRPASQMALDLPRSEPSFSSPLPEAEPEIPSPKQRYMWTDEEAGARAPQIMALKGELYGDLPKGSHPFIDDLTAASRPEAVKELQAKLETYDEAGKTPPAGFKKLAEHFGVLDDTITKDTPAGESKSPAERVAAAAKSASDIRADAQAQADKIKADAKAKYDENIQVLNKRNMLNEATQKQASVLQERQRAKAKDVMDAAEAAAKPFDDEAARVKPMADLHAQAEALPDKSYNREVPPSIDEAQHGLWHNMDALAEHSDDPKFADAAKDIRDRMASKDPQALIDGKNLLNRWTESERTRLRKGQPIPQGFLDKFDREQRDVGHMPETADVDNLHQFDDRVWKPRERDGLLPDSADVRAAEKSTQGAPAALDPNDGGRAAAGDANPMPNLPPDGATAQTIKKIQARQKPAAQVKQETKLADAQATSALTGGRVKDVEDAKQGLSQLQLERQAMEARIAADQAARAQSKQEQMRQRAAATDTPANAAAAKAAGAIDKAAPKVLSIDEVKARLMAARNPLKAKISNPYARTQSDVNLEHIVQAGGTGKDVLEHLRQNGDSEFVRQLAGRLQRLGVDPKIEFGIPEDAKTNLGHKAEDLSAAYDENTNTVHIGDRSNLQANMLHEIIHAATHEAISKGGPAAQRMQAIFDRVMATDKMKVLERAKALPYGMTDLHEFVAEAFSNKGFQKMLDDIPSPNQPKKSMWQAFKDVIAKMLGMPERTRSVLDEVVAAGHTLMDEPRTGSIQDQHAEIRGKVSNMDDLLAASKTWLRDEGLGKLNMKFGARGTVLGFHTVTHIADMWGKLMPSLKDFVLARHDREVQSARYNQTHKIGRDAAALAIKAQPKLEEPLQNVMGYTRFNIDPTKAWEQQPWLHNLKNALQLKQMVREANIEYNKVKQFGGADAYEKLKASNRGDEMAKMANVVHSFVTTTYPDIKDQVFAQHPGDVWQHDMTGLHESPEATAKFWEDHLNKQLDAAKTYADGLTAQLADAKPAEKAALGKKIDALAEMTGDMNTRVKQLNQGPYFHQGRYGKFFVSGHLNLVNGEVDPGQIDKLQKRLEAAGFGDIALNRIGTKSTVFMRVKTADQMAALHKIMSDAQAAGELDKTKEVSKGVPGQPNILSKIAPGYLQRLAENAKNSDAFTPADDAPKEVKAALAKAKETYVQELHDQYMDMLSDNSVTKVNQRRENIQGYNKDMLRNFDHRAQIAANALSNVTAADKISKSMAAMRNDVDNLNKSGTPDQALAAHQVLTELARRETERSWNVDTDFADKARAANHVFFLGASPAYMIEQLSQIPMLLLPELGKKHGFVASAQAIGRATPLAFKIMKAMATGQHRWDAIITPKMLADAGVADKDAKFIMGVVNRGGLDLGGFVREMGSAARGGEVNAFTKTMQRANATAVYAETFSRVVAALSARDLHEAKTPIKDGNVAPRDQYVDHVINQSMMDWGSWNTSRQTGKNGLFGKASPLMLSFTGFQTRMVEKLYREAAAAMGAHGASAEEMAESRRFLAGHLAAATVISGSMGLPFAASIAGAASNLGNALTGKDDYDVESSYRNFLANTFGKEAGEVIAKGAPRAAGLDLSDLGDGSLLDKYIKPLTDRRKLEESVPDWLKGMAGSPLAGGLSIIEGMRDWAHGVPLSVAGAKMAPAAIKGPLEAYRMSQHGYENKDGVKLPMDASTADIMMRAVGLEPEDKAEYTEKARSATELKEARSEREQYIKQRMLLAHAHGDRDEMQSATGAAQAFQQDNPMQGFLQRLPQMIQQQQNEGAVARATGMPVGFGMNEQKIRSRLGY